MANNVELIPVDDGGNNVELVPVQGGRREVPGWGERNPNTYAAVMTLADLLPMAAQLAKSSPVGVPLAAALNAGGQAVKRKINDEPITLEALLNDAAAGALGQAVGDVVGKGVLPVVGKALPENWITGLYGKALKPSPQAFADPAARRAMVERGVSEGITLDDAGYVKLMDNIMRDSRAVESMIDTASNAGTRVLTRQAEDAFASGGAGSLEYLANQLNRAHPELKAALDARKSVMRAEGPAVDIRKAQDLKKHYQNQASYPKDTRGLYDEQIDQATAAGYREAIETALPDVAPLNKANSTRADLKKQLAPAIGRIENRDPIGLGTRVATAPLGEGSSLASVANVASSAFQNFPKLEAKTAIAMYKAKTGKTLPISQWRVAARLLAEEGTRRALTAGIEESILGTSY